jgi:hypothetical protein
MGTRVLATADAPGGVDAAIYTRPHFIYENTLAVIMAERLTQQNLESNPHATHLFIESGPGYVGKKLYLTKAKEETNEELVKRICRRFDYSMYDVRRSVDQRCGLISCGSGPAISRNWRPIY